MPIRIAVAVLLLARQFAGQESWRSMVSAATRLQNERRFAEAERLYLSALEVARAAEPGPAPEATILHNLGGLYQDTGRCDDAARTYQRSIGLWEKAGPRGDGYLFATANHLTGLYLECGMVEMAERHYQARIAPRIAGAAGDDLADAGANLGSIEFHKHAYAAALAHFREALVIRERLSRAPSLDMAVLLNNLASALLRTGEVEQSLAYSRSAMEMMEAVTGPEHPLLVGALVNGADLQLLARHPSGAEPLLERALAMSRRVHGDDHPLTAVVMAHYAVLLKATRRKKQAAVLESQAREILVRFPGTRRQTVDLRELELSLRE